MTAVVHYLARLFSSPFSLLIPASTSPGRRAEVLQLCLSGLYLVYLLDLSCQLLFLSGTRLSPGVCLECPNYVVVDWVRAFTWLTSITTSDVCRFWGFVSFFFFFLDSGGIEGTGYRYQTEA